MRVLQQLFDNNETWSERVRREDPQFFERLSQQQSPRYLWIGCSDSRVPANQITGLAPGEVFVHRNVGNLVVHTDLNCLSVIDFAVDLLRVKHVIVVGHHGCSGVRLALQRSAVGLAENWLRHIQDVHRAHAALVDTLDDEERRVNLLAELNVVEQAVNVCESTIVQSAWRRGAGLAVHGWIYSLRDGLLVDLGFAAAGAQQVAAARSAALERIAERYRAS